MVTSSSVSTPLPHSPFPGLWTDERIRAAYSEGAGIYRIVPAGVAIPRGVEDLQQLVRWAAETGTPLVARVTLTTVPVVGRLAVIRRETE